MIKNLVSPESQEEIRSLVNSVSLGSHGNLVETESPESPENPESQGNQESLVERRNLVNQRVNGNLETLTPLVRKSHLRKRELCTSPKVSKLRNKSKNRNVKETSVRNKSARKGRIEKQSIPLISHWWLLRLSYPNYPRRTNSCRSLVERISIRN